MLLINSMQQLNNPAKRRILVLLFPNTRNLRGALKCINQKVVHQIFLNCMYLVLMNRISLAPNIKTCLSSKDFCMAKKVKNLQNFPIKEDVIVFSNFSCPEQLEMKHVCSTKFKELASSDDSMLVHSVVHKEPLHEADDDAMNGLYLM
jgi:hypothetical protein